MTLLVAKEAINALPSLAWPELAADAARHMARGEVSKFQPCLAEGEEDRLLADKLLDVEGTLAFLSPSPLRGRGSG